jgi:methyl-accepting chemotaxis protein
LKMGRDYTFAIRVLSSAVVSSIFAGILLAWWISRSITRPMQEAVRLARTVAAGDLTGSIAMSSVDADSVEETGQLLAALKEMSRNLSEIVGRVRSGSDAIDTATGQFASGAQELSARTEAQASSLEQTAASMEQLTSVVKQNAENASQASTVSALEYC